MRTPGRPKSRFRPYAPPLGVAPTPMRPPTTPAAPIGQPCWHCAWYHHYNARHWDQAGCLNPSCSPYRSTPENGCSCWELDPSRASDPRPTTSPGPALLNAFRRQRDGLEAIVERANGFKQPWEARRYVLDRTGRLGPPVRRTGAPCECCGYGKDWTHVSFHVRAAHIRGHQGRRYDELQLVDEAGETRTLFANPALRISQRLIVHVDDVDDQAVADLALSVLGPQAGTT